MDSRIVETNVQSESDHQELLKAQAYIWKHALNFINSMFLKCAIELSVPDTIHSHGSAMTLPELVAKLPIHPSKASHVQRLMRILSHSGFFALQKLDNDQQGYVLTHVSRLLVKDNPFSVSPFVLAMLQPYWTASSQNMSTWFQNDDATPFETVHRVPAWEYLGREPRFSALFNSAMSSDASLISSALTCTYKEVFEGVNTLVDVGGGTGTMAKAIADVFPDIECTVFDLPHVVAGLRGVKNLKFRGGDMFQDIPPANAVLLKWILHDWSDEECLKILKKCKEALQGSNGGKVIIIDIVMENHSKDNESYETQLLFDALIMTLLSGRERDEKDWAKLFSEAGFRTYTITPILGLRSLIQLYP